MNLHLGSQEEQVRDLASRSDTTMSEIVRSALQIGLPVVEQRLGDHGQDLPPLFLSAFVPAYTPSRADPTTSIVLHVGPGDRLDIHGDWWPIARYRLLGLCFDPISGGDPAIRGLRLFGGAELLPCGVPLQLSAWRDDLGFVGELRPRLRGRPLVAAPNRLQATLELTPGQPAALFRLFAIGCLPSDVAHWASMFPIQQDG